MRRARLALVTALAAGLAASLPSRSGRAEGEADAEDAGPWLAHLRECLRPVFSLEARFTEERIHPLGPQVAPLTGRVVVRRGGRLRLEYSGPEKMLVVSDGKTIFAHRPKDRLAVTAPAAREGLGFELQDWVLGGESATAFRSRLLSGDPRPGAGLAVVELVPQASDPFVASVVVVMDGACPGLRRVLVVDHSGAVLRFTLEDVRTNVGHGQRAFELHLPPRTKVVRP